MHLLVIEIWCGVVCGVCGVVWRQRPEARPGQRAALTDVGGTTVLISLLLCLALLPHQLAPTLLAKMTKKKLVILPVGWKFNRRFSKREKSGLSNEPGLLLCEAFRDSKVNTQLGQMVQCSKTKKLYLKTTEYRNINPEIPCRKAEEAGKAEETRKTEEARKATEEARGSWDEPVYLTNLMNLPQGYPKIYHQNKIQESKKGKEIQRKKKIKRIPFKIQENIRNQRMISEWENEAQMEVRKFGNHILIFIFL